MKGTAILYEDNHVITCLEDIKFTDLENYLPKKTEESYPVNPQHTMWHPEEIDWDYGY